MCCRRDVLEKKLYLPLLFLSLSLSSVRLPVDLEAARLEGELQEEEGEEGSLRGFESLLLSAASTHGCLTLGFRLTLSQC